MKIATEPPSRSWQEGISQSYLVKESTELLLKDMQLFWVQNTKRSAIAEIHTGISWNFYNTDALDKGYMTVKSACEVRSCWTRVSVLCQMITVRANKWCGVSRSFKANQERSWNISQWECLSLLLLYLLLLTYVAQYECMSTFSDTAQITYSLTCRNRSSLSVRREQ